MTETVNIVICDGESGSKVLNHRRRSEFETQAGTDERVFVADTHGYLEDRHVEEIEPEASPDTLVPAAIFVIVQKYPPVVQKKAYPPASNGENP